MVVPTYILHLVGQVPYSDRGPKTVKGAQSDPNYVSRLCTGISQNHHPCLYLGLLYRSGPVAIYQGCRGHGDPHGYGYGVGMGMIFHPHKPMGILWGFLINLK